MAHTPADAGSGSPHRILPCHAAKARAYMIAHSPFSESLPPQQSITSVLSSGMTTPEQAKAARDAAIAYAVNDADEVLAANKRPVVFLPKYAD